MRARFLHILIHLTRLVASTVIVPAALIAGFLSMPTTCTCGADYPHVHPLNGIAGHHHDHGRIVTTTPPPSRDTLRAGMDGISVETSTSAATPGQTAIANASDTPQRLPRPRTTEDRVDSPEGRRLSPEVPPPQA